MAGRKKTGKKKRAKTSRGTSLPEVTEAQYRRAMEMIRNGAFEVEIRNVCQLTSAQWHALKHQGDPARKWEPLIVVQARETSEAIGAARDAAIAIGGRAGEMLAAAMTNCGNAQMIVNEILVGVGKSLLENKTGKVGDAMPDAKVTKMLQALAPYADVGRVADAFAKVFGDRVGAMAAARVTGKAPDGMQPAALAMLAEQRGSGDGDEAASALLREVLEWNEGQIDRFLETGEEPGENEIGPQTH